MIQNDKIKKISAVTLLLMAFTGFNFIPRQSHPNISEVANAEALAPRDIVFVFDTSGSMAYETSGNPFSSDSGDDPSACNANDTCQPMQAIKDEALEFINLLDFSKDRVAIVTMTSQTPGGSRDPVEVLPLTSDQAAVQAAIQNIKVFEPRICDGSGAPGECLQFVNGTFNKTSCETFQLALSNSDPNVQASADPSSCPSSNIGGVLKLAQQALAGSGDPDSIRLDASWEVIALVAGPANSSTPDVNHPYGYCPQNTWLFMWMPDPKPKLCRDAIPGNERSASSPLVNYTNPVNGQQMNISLYDAEDYARDMADNLAAMRSGGGVKIYTIGLGAGVTSTANGTPAVTCTIEETIGPRPCGEAEYLLTYIAREAGDTLATYINHGEYFYTPNDVALRAILQLLANHSGANTAGLCYVNDDAGGTNTGASWANAYTSLQSALADSCTEIWVAAGTYKPHTSDRTVFFTLENGVSIYGGFAGTETLRTQRNAATNVTILSGDIDNNDTNTDGNNITEIHTDIQGSNSYHVVVGSGTDNTAVLDGFTITAGQANGSDPNNLGGGIYNDGGSPTLSTLTFAGNSASVGGGMFNANSNLSITNSTFSGNFAEFGGGGVYNTSSSPSISNVTFSDNSATSGGGMFNLDSSPSIINSTFSDNFAITGGGIYNATSSPTLKNTIIANSTSGSDCWNDGSSSINTSSSHNLIEATGTNACDITASFGGGSNIVGSDPNLLPLLTGSPAYFLLLAGSPAIDAGSNAICAAAPVNNTSQNGAARPQDGNNDSISACDMGTYEHEYNSIAPTVTSILRRDANPTSAATVDFFVYFSEFVLESQSNDFTLSTNGVTGAKINKLTYYFNSPTANEETLMIVEVATGTGNGTIRLDIPGTATIIDTSGNLLSNIPYTSGEVYTINKTTPLPTGWVGSVSVTSDKNLVSVGRPHIGAEVASYDGFASGSTTAFVPMLFKDAFGGDYDAALYIQNVSGSSASVTIEFYDNTGALNCTKSDTIAPLASKGYWLPSVSCDTGSLPSGWVGGVKVSSDQPVVAVGRPHVGSEVMTYNGFSSGSTSAFIPMLFKGAFGGSYNAAFYVQNVSASLASITLEYFDNTGTLNCTKTDTLAALASKGYWVPAATCDTGALPAGWVGGVRVTSDQDIVTVGRPHIDTQITTYDGFSAGSASSYVPMLFKGAFGGSYNAAYYIQNVSNASANVTIKYYDNAGTLNCTKSDTIAALASKGYWVPAATCDTGSLPAGWVGGVEVTSDQPIVSVGRPHIDAQVTTYNGFSTGALNAFLPMLFKDAFGGDYDSAFYLQNTEATEASVTIRFYNSAGVLTCSRTNTIQPRATLGFWVPAATCFP